MRGHAADHVGDVLKVFGTGTFRFAEVFRHGAAEGFVDAKFDGAATDAVDAEDEIEQRANDRDGPDDDKPEDGGASVPLVEQGMAGGEEAGNAVTADGDVRPELLENQLPVHAGESVAEN